MDSLISRFSKYVFERFDNNFAIFYNLKNGQTIILDKKDYDNLRSNIIDESIYNCFFSKGFLDKNTIDGISKCVSSRKIMIRIFSTTKCNAACPYCYEKGIRKIDLDIKSANSVIEFLKYCASKKYYNEYELIWFGGEPLVNYDIIKYICTQIKEQIPTINFYSFLVTNGILLNDMILKDLIKTCNLKKIQITIDNIDAEYDKEKRVPNGTFNKVIDNIKLIIHTGIKPNIKLNYSEKNILKIKKLIEFFYELKFNNRINLGLSALFDDNSVEDSIFIREKYNKLLVNTLIKCGFIKINQLIPKSLFRPCLMHSCNYFSIYIDGTIYKCDRSFSNKNIVGNINNTDFNKILSYESKHDFSAKCDNCTLFPICAGGCEYERLIGKSGCLYTKQMINERLDVILRFINEMNIKKNTIKTNNDFQNEILNTIYSFEDNSRWDVSDVAENSIGEISYSIFKDTNGVKFGYLENIKVWDEYRNIGIGSYLINELCKYLRKKACKYIMGEVGSDDLRRGILFYKKNGFSVTPDGFERNIQHIILKNL